MTAANLQSNKAIVRKYIEEVVNTGATEKISEYIAPEYVEVSNEKRYELGIPGAQKHIEGVRATYPDLKLAIQRQVCEGEWVATYYIMTGTLEGEWLGIRPTHQKIRVAGVNFDRIVDGKIVEHTGAANLLEPLLEIKAIKVV